MAKDKSVIVTKIDELPGIPPAPKKRGRPVTGKALSNSERQARNRNWKKLQAEFEADRIKARFAHLTDDAVIDYFNTVSASRALEKTDLRDAYIEYGRRKGFL